MNWGHDPIDHSKWRQGDKLLVCYTALYLMANFVLMSLAASRLIPNPSSVMMFFAFVGPIMNIIVLIAARTILGEGSYSTIGLWLSMALLALAALLSFKLIAAISADVWSQELSLRITEGWRASNSPSFEQPTSTAWRRPPMEMSMLQTERPRAPMCRPSPASALTSALCY